MKIITPGNKIEMEGPTAVALGFFDGVHIGHAAVIGAAVATGLPAVVVTFSQHPSALLKDRTVYELTSDPLKEKILAGMGVDTLCYLDFRAVMDLSAERFLMDYVISGMKAAQVFCGYNYRFGRGGEAGPEELRAICRQYGVRGVSAAPVCENGAPVSSTRIRALIERGEMEQAARLLGRPFRLYAEIVHGRMLGRQLGAPTINQAFPDTLVRPRFGVYASYTHIGGVPLPSVTNVGVKPTVGGSRLLAETYIMGYNGNLYGKTLMVDLMSFLRPETKFASVDELADQIAKDADDARAALGS